MPTKKKLTIALITNLEPHHKYLAYKLYKEFKVVAILHPDGGGRGKLYDRIMKYRKRGFIWMILKLFSIIYQKLSRQSIKTDITLNETKFFSKYIGKYNEIPKDIILHVDSINDPKVIKFLKAKEVDVVCMLGGEIAKKEIISCSRVAFLNFHSGISPFYNGVGTTQTAISDFNPNFVGGTLMHITEKIDGGSILAHFLPKIENGDSVGSLFMKIIIGSVYLYRIIINELEKGKMPVGVKQGKAFRQIFSSDWTLEQDLRISYFNRKNMIRKYIREERIITYIEDQNTSTASLTNTLFEILGS